MTEGHSNILYYDLQVVINNEIKPSANASCYEVG
jgi:hypothetical protein